MSNTRCETILREMQEHRYDCIVGGITITSMRERALAWSIPYMTTTLSLVVNAARTPDTTGLAYLKTATVGVQAATTDYDVAVVMQDRNLAAAANFPPRRVAYAHDWCDENEVLFKLASRVGAAEGRPVRASVMRDRTTAKRYSATQEAALRASACPT